MGLACRFAHSEQELRRIKPAAQQVKGKKTSAPRQSVEVPPHVVQSQHLEAVAQSQRLEAVTGCQIPTAFFYIPPPSRQFTESSNHFSDSGDTTEVPSGKDESYSEDSQEEGFRTPTDSDAPDHSSTPIKLMDFLEISASSQKVSQTVQSTPYSSEGYEQASYCIPPADTHEDCQTNLTTAESDAGIRKCNKWDDHNLLGSRGFHPASGMNFVIRNTFLEFEEVEPVRPSLRRSSSANALPMVKIWS